MGKARLTVTYVFEYDIIPEHYGDCETDEQRMNFDIESYRTEPSMLDMVEARSFEIKGELLPE